MSACAAGSRSVARLSLSRAPTSRIIDVSTSTARSTTSTSAGAHRVTAGAREVEQVLDAVRDFLDRRHAERAGVALDRVERAEDVVEQLGVARALVERKQRGLDRAEVIQSFGDEQIGHLRVVTQECQLVICHDVP